MANVSHPVAGSRGRLKAVPRRLERLSALDVSTLRVERYGAPMHVAALAVVDGTALLDAAGRLRLEDVRAEVESRLRLAPRLRQVLTRPRRGLGTPVWADDPHFDIRQHVRAGAVPSPGDEAALLALCAELNEPRLERSRPLWQMWLLPGLADGNVGVLIRLHHAVADGIAAIAVIGALFDTTPDTPPLAVPAWRPAPEPGAWRIFSDGWCQRAAAMAAAGHKVRHPALAFHRLGSLARQMRQLAGEGMAPRVSLNRPTGMSRRLKLVRADLAAVKAVAHGHAATVNDVVLTAVTCGARRLLADRGELTPGLILKASVATSIRGAGELADGGNRVAIMLAPLPVGEPDPARQLVQIAAATKERKRYPPYQPAGRFGQRWMVRAMPHQRLVNLFTSNLPGPPEPLYLAGGRVLEVFQVGVVQGNVTVGVGVLSYAGQLNFSVVGDSDAIPDLQVFADGLSCALTRLGAGRLR